LIRVWDFEQVLAQVKAFEDSLTAPSVAAN
jgi:hypothetical protein